MANKRDKCSLVREGEPSKKTEKGLEIPVPRADEFFALLKNEIRKAAPRREKPS